MSLTQLGLFGEHVPVGQLDSRLRAGLDGLRLGVWYGADEVAHTGCGLSKAEAEVVLADLFERGLCERYLCWPGHWAQHWHYRINARGLQSLS